MEQAAPQTAIQPQALTRTKKKRTGCVVVTVILVLLMCCCIGALAAAWPITKALTGQAEAEDLGVDYTEADYASALNKLDVDWDTGVGQPNVDTQMMYEGAKQIDAALTEAEASAILANLNSPRFPIKDVQVKLLNNNQAQVSTLVTYGGRDYPVKTTVSANIKGNKASGKIIVIYVGNIKIPVAYWPRIEAYVLKLINGRFARMTGLNITKFEIKRGRLHIVGTVPAKAWREKQ